MPGDLPFRRKDGFIPADEVKAKLADAQPGVPVHIYDKSGHGFNNDGRPDSDPDDAALARKRTLELFERTARPSGNGRNPAEERGRRVRIRGLSHRPDDARHGGLVLIQEIFGVTEHIRELADSYAASGYEVIAPSLYDRLEPGFASSYAPEDMGKAVRYSQGTPWDEVAGDLQATIDALTPPVFAMGFCWGGAATWLAACRCTGLAAASSFYGRRISELAAETPRCPIILHFGKTDASIPPATIEQIAAAHPDIPIHLYDAGHGFVSDRRADYDPDCARLARLRTLQLFQRSTGARGEH